MFLPELDREVEVAIFSGVMHNIMGRIGRQTHKAGDFKSNGGTFERDVLGEDLGRPQFSVRPIPPSQPADWLLKCTQRCCFSLTSVVCSLIYLDKLIKLRKVMFSSSAWDVIWVCLMILSEKTWEDNYIHPGHVVYTCISDRVFQNDKRAYKEMQRMQFWLLEALDWRMHIAEGTFYDWVHFLGDMGRRGTEIAMPMTVFVPRPIPNLKVRRPSQQTTSTASTATQQYSSHQATPVENTIEERTWNCWRARNERKPRHGLPHPSWSQTTPRNPKYTDPRDELRRETGYRMRHLADERNCIMVNYLH